MLPWRSAGWGAGGCTGTTDCLGRLTCEGVLLQTPAFVPRLGANACANAEARGCESLFTYLSVYCVTVAYVERPLALLRNGYPCPVSFPGQRIADLDFGISTKPAEPCFPLEGARWFESGLPGAATRACLQDL